MTIEQCSVLGEQVLSVMGIILVSIVITALVYKAVKQINKWTTNFETINVPVIKKEFVIIPSFVTAAILLFTISPLKPTSKQTVNSVVYYKGKEVLPCDKSKESKVSFFFKKKYKTMICSL